MLEDPVAPVGIKTPVHPLLNSRMKTTPLPLLVVLLLEKDTRGIVRDKEENEMISEWIFLSLKVCQTMACSSTRSELWRESLSTSRCQMKRN